MPHCAIRTPREVNPLDYQWHLIVAIMFLAAFIAAGVGVSNQESWFISRHPHCNIESHNEERSLDKISGTW